MKKIVVIGSSNVDTTLHVKDFPKPGETINALDITTAGGGKGDLYCEFEDFTILTEVTMSTSSRQEAMEGEPVRRHVSDAVAEDNRFGPSSVRTCLYPGCGDQGSAG